MVKKYFRFLSENPKLKEHKFIIINNKALVEYEFFDTLKTRSNFVLWMERNY